MHKTESRAPCTHFVLFLTYFSSCLAQQHFPVKRTHLQWQWVLRERKIGCVCVRVREEEPTCKTITYRNTLGREGSAHMRSINFFETLQTDVIDAPIGKGGKIKIRHRNNDFNVFNRSPCFWPCFWLAFDSRNDHRQNDYDSFSFHQWSSIRCNPFVHAVHGNGFWISRQRWWKMCMRWRAANILTTRDD